MCRAGARRQHQTDHHHGISRYDNAEGRGGRGRVLSGRPGVKTPLIAHRRRAGAESRFVDVIFTTLTSGRQQRAMYGRPWREDVHRRGETAQLHLYRPKLAAETVR